MDDATRNEIADSLDRLASESHWNPDLWQHCYDLVGANADNELLQYVDDDLIHYTATPLFKSRPRPADLKTYEQEFRDSAEALRKETSLAEFKSLYPWWVARFEIALTTLGPREI